MNSGDMPSESSIINSLSCRFDDVILISRILLNGTVVTSKVLKPSEELRNIIRNTCNEGLCYAHLRLASLEGKEVGEVKLFLYDGNVVACIAEIAGKKLYGDAALKVIGNLRNAGIGSVKLIEYRFDPSLLDQSIRETLLKLKGGAITQQAIPHQEETRSPQAENVALERSRVKEVERADQKMKEPEVMDVKAYVACKLRNVGVPVTNTALVESKKYVVLDIICDEDREIPPPENIVLAAIRHYIEASGEGKPMGKVRVTVHHKKTHSETYDLSKDVRIWKLLGAIPEVLWKHGLYVDKLKYRVRKGGLEISLTLKRHGIYSTANIHEVTKEIYERLKSEWNNNLVVKAKIGAWGMEVKYP